MDAHEIAMEALAQAQDTGRDTRRLIEELRDLFSEPSDPRTITLTAVEPVKQVQGSGDSVTVINPTSLTLYLGIGGASAAPSGRGIPVPARSMLTLPLRVTNIDIGADPAAAELAGGATAVVYVLLNAGVYSPFVGALS